MKINVKIREDNNKLIKYLYDNNVYDNFIDSDINYNNFSYEFKDDIGVLQQKINESERKINEKQTYILEINKKLNN